MEKTEPDMSKPNPGFESGGRRSNLRRIGALGGDQIEASSTGLGVRSGKGKGKGKERKGNAQVGEGFEEEGRNLERRVFAEIRAGAGIGRS